ncbi:MAG: serine/threonine transporter SstT [Clostridia bacterium]|nr:serine/threonine transporter SstT [Clostridia bacterium]
MNKVNNSKKGISSFFKSALTGYVAFPLIARIAIGLVIGAVLGLAWPGMPFIATLGTLFVGALKAIAPILVFVLIISALSTAGKGIGKRFGTVISLYMITTFLAALIAVIFSYVFKVSITLTDPPTGYTPPSDLFEVISSLFMKMIENPVSALINGNYVGILLWAILIGLALRAIASEQTKTVFSDISSGISKIVGWIIQLAPFGITGLAFSAVSELGLSIFADYGSLLLLLVGCMLLVSLVINPFIIFLFLRRNPYPLVLRCLKESGIQAFFARSSAANIPVNMKLCRDLGLDEQYYSVAIPLGATINMDGAAITITVMSLTAAFSTGVEPHILVAFLLSLIATLGACGASGVPGGSLLLIPMACSLLGVDASVAMQMVGVGFMIGVIQDSVETALNSSGDVMFAATAEFYEWKKQGKPICFTEKERQKTLIDKNISESM